jgi:hypothetical protein
MIQDLPTMRKVLQAWSPGFTPDECDRAINRAYDELSRVHPWIKLEREFKFVTKAYKDVGGVHFTNAAVTVTAADNISAAWGTSAGGTNLDFTGMFVKKNVDDEAGYYTITSNTSNEITITEAYLGKTTTAVVSSGDSYFIFQHVYAVPSAIETVTLLMGSRLLEEDEKYLIEDRLPDFNGEGEPRSWFNYGVNSANVALVQLYPPKVDDVYELRGWGRLKIEELTGTAKPLIDSNLIVSFAEVELMKRKKMMAPNTISDDMLKDSMGQAQMKLDAAVELDKRQRTHAKYVQDRMFRSTHPGQKWLVQHDPWEF